MTEKFVTLPREVVKNALDSVKNLFELDCEEDFLTILEHKAIYNAVQKLRSALEHPQIQSGVIPPNWKLVPVEPTMSMQHAALIESRSHGTVSTRECNALPISYELGASAMIYRARSAAAPQPPEHYDQQALDLCSTCGWKTLIPGDCCLNCAQHQPQGDQGAVGFVRQVDIEHLGNTPSDWASMFGQATGYNTVPVYTRPQPRHPLTDEAVLGVAKSIEIQFDSERLNEQIDDILAFARAIEAAHNIK